MFTFLGAFPVTFPSQLPYSFSPSLFLFRISTNFPLFRCLSPTCGWHLYRRVIRIARSSTSGKQFCPFRRLLCEPWPPILQVFDPMENEGLPSEVVTKTRPHMSRGVKRSRSTKKERVERFPYRFTWSTASAAGLLPVLLISEASSAIEWSPIVLLSLTTRPSRHICKKAEK